MVRGISRRKISISRRRATGGSAENFFRVPTRSARTLESSSSWKTDSSSRSRPFVPMALISTGGVRARCIFRHPEEDARRRDFTINGMFFDPAKNEVIDFVGGREDLEAKLIRAIGDPAQRFAEDRLRMLRAIRFATVLEFRDRTRNLGCAAARRGVDHRDQRGTNSRRAGANFSFAEAGARLGFAR